MPLVIIIFEDNARKVVCKLLNALSAAAARRAGAGILATTGDGYPHNAFATSGYHCRYRPRFSAANQRIDSVLDIAANMKVSLVVDQCSTDSKIRVRAVCLFTYLSRGIQEFVVSHVRSCASGCSGG